MPDFYGNKRSKSSYILTSRGEAVCQLLQTILSIETNDQLLTFLRNLKGPSREISTDEVRAELAEISAKLSAQEVLIKALFAVCPKNNQAQGKEFSLTQYHSQI